MNKLKLKKIIRTILEAESGAAKQAKAMGLRYGKFGRWVDPKIGKVVAKSHGDTLIKVDPGKDEDPKDPKSREDDTLKQMQRYQAVGKQGTPQKAVHPADVPRQLHPGVFPARRAQGAVAEFRLLARATSAHGEVVHQQDPH